jgi:AcrR family transcriptional regulator
MASKTSQTAKPSATAWELRRAEIVRQAALLFDRDGYSNTSMNSIAVAANLQKASLYHYCESKTDLLVQIHNDFMKLLFDRLESVPRGDTPPEERLRAVVRHIVSLMHTHRPHVRTFFEHYRELPPGPRREIASRRRLYEDSVVGMLRDGVDDSAFRQVDPYYATMAVFGVCNWVYQWYGREPGRDPDEVADALWDLIAHGISGTPLSDGS